MRNPKISLWILPRIPSPHPAIYVAQLVGYGFFFAFVSVLLKKLKAIDIVYVRESWLAFGFVSLRSLISPIAAKVPFNCAKETFGEHKNGFAGVYVRLAAQLERYAIMNADFLFTAPGSSQKLIQIRGDERGVTELRQPIPLDFFGAHSLGTYNKKEYVVGYVGDISPNHMVDVVVRAMRLVQNELPNVRLLLAGDADPGNLLKIIQLMNNLKLENSVMLRVDESNIPKLYESMDLVVVPNIRSLGRSGAVGLKFVEAVAANVPFVASRTVALQNLLAGSGIEDVVFVDSDDPREWASKIRALMMHHDLRQHVATVVSSHLKSYLESHRPEAVAATFITRYGLQPIGQGSVDPSCTTHSER
jgi:glycosyltransferase involved in cell wall biosynthesis